MSRCWEVSAGDVAVKLAFEWLKDRNAWRKKASFFSQGMPFYFLSRHQRVLYFFSA
jgi:hypothetical protein